eukprot:9882942-Ditylum_brightwellii.AAC.2
MQNGSRQERKDFEQLDFESTNMSIINALFLVNKKCGELDPPKERCSSPRGIRKWWQMGNLFSEPGLLCSGKRHFYTGEMMFLGFSVAYRRFTNLGEKFQGDLVVKVNKDVKSLDVIDCPLSTRLDAKYVTRAT